MQIWRWPRRTTFWTPRLLRIPSGSAPGRWPISTARALSCLRPGPARSPGEPAGPAVAQRRNLCRDRAGGAGGGTDPIFLVASNPVDIMTQIVTVLAGRHGVAPERVIGSGTILDSARFRTLLAAHLGISPAYIDARVLGEHGDSEVLHWSGAVAGNLPVADAARQMGRELTDADRSRIDTAVRRAAYAIIQGKGATWFGVGAGLARMAQVIQGDERALITCSMLTAGVPGRARRGPVPAARARRGRRREDVHAKSRRGERAALKRSAEILKEAAEGVRFSDRARDMHSLVHE